MNLDMAESEIDELNALFATALEAELEPDLLAELQSIMRLHSIPPQELFYKWESYCIKMGFDDMKLNIDTARALKKDVQDGLERETRSKVHARSAEKRGGAQRNVSNATDVYDILEGLVPNNSLTNSTKINSTTKRKFETPSISRVKVEPASSPPQFKTPSKTPSNLGEHAIGTNTVSFNARPNAGQTIEVLNEHLKVGEPPIAPYARSRVKLVANFESKKLSYKPMAMKLSEASEILDDRIDEFMLLIQTHHHLEDSAFGSAANQSTSEIVAVGRIASDSPSGKLNAKSLVLETSRRMGAGLRVPVKLDSVSGFQCFPGQIVALRGINASGEFFTVTEILDVPLLQVAASTPSALEAHIQRLHGDLDTTVSDSPPAPLSILISSGPYTADENLDFEPLHALCDQAAESYADTLILTGPFLDIDHPLIASGDFDLPEEALSEPDVATMTTVFKYLVVPAFQKLVSSNPSITIILVPSIRDAVSAHVCWPQEPIPRKDLGLPKAVRLVGNPMSLSINEIVTSISSQDVLFELRHEEVTGGKIKDTNLLGRLPRYLIEQRHFFPLFPPADRHSLPKAGTIEGITAGAMLDTSYLKLGEMLNVRPDMLVVPSALTPFVKVVESVLVINPGFLSKRKAAGTYAKLTVYPAALTEEERIQGKKVGHKLFERTRVDIIRI